MKYTFLSLFLFSVFIAHSQTIDFKKPLFDEMGFFQTNKVQEKSIKSISITKSDKDDGKIFKRESSFLYYEFLSNGKLNLSQKYTRTRAGYDTSQFNFYYDNDNKIYKRRDLHGPFDFEYYFIRKKGEVIKEIKVDRAGPAFDTAYIRYFKHNRFPLKKVSTTLNSANKAFQVKTLEWDKQNRILKEELRFTRSSNYKEVSYKHQLNFLLEKSENSYFGKALKRTWKLKYKEGLVDLLVLTENETPLKMYAFLYDNGLPSAIIERNLRDKRITVYKLTYEFYD